MPVGKGMPCQVSCLESETSGFLFPWMVGQPLLSNASARWSEGTSGGQSTLGSFLVTFFSGTMDKALRDVWHPKY